MSVLLKKAEKFARNQDYASAYNLLIEADSSGDPTASYALGTWYLFGRHVKKDYKKAVDFLTKASKGGSIDALYNLAVCYEKGAGVEKNDIKAFQNYLMAFRNGDIKSAYEIGRCLYYGIGVEKNRELADYFLNLNLKSSQKQVNSISSNKRMRRPANANPEYSIVAG